jgi:multiple sugar transport system permease protein
MANTMSETGSAVATAVSHSEVAKGDGPRRWYHPKRLLMLTVIFLVMFITLWPFYWMLRTALSNGRSLASNSGSILPADFTWGAFKRVFGLSTVAEAQAEGGSGAKIDFWLYLRNSVIVSVVITVLQTFFSALAAYAFARMQWPGRDKVFGIFLAALMIPGIFTMLPNFLLIKELGLLNTLTGIVLPFIFMSPFAIFFLRQFFLGINKEIEEAARLDGAGHFKIFLRVVLPMSSAPVFTLFILTYIGAWNEYFWPLLVASGDKVRVLTVALGVFRSQTPQGSPDWPGLMAATLVAALPIIVVFAVFGKKIVNNIQFSGIK